MAKSGKAAKGKTGPYLTAAMICEKILKEEDGVTSAMRIVDIVNLSGEPSLPPLGTVIGLPLALLVMLKSGDFRGDRDILIILATPSGIKVELGKVRVIFTGPPESGVNSQVPVLAIQWDGEGLYWYEIVMEDAVLTRIPLRVNVTQKSAEATVESAKESLAPKRKRRS